MWFKKQKDEKLSRRKRTGTFKEQRCSTSLLQEGAKRKEKKKKKRCAIPQYGGTKRLVN